MSEAQKPFAWVHTVKQHGGDGTEDFALSFLPDNFPLQGEESGMFFSVGKPRPLYLLDSVDRCTSCPGFMPCRKPGKDCLHRTYKYGAAKGD